MKRTQRPRQPRTRYPLKSSSFFESGSAGLLPAGVGLALVALALVAYSRVLLNGFVNYDDELYVTQNPVVQSGLTVHSLYYALTGVCSSNWHPVTMLSHILDCTLFGLSPAGHHLTSLVLHSANTLLLYLVLRRMTGALWPSALVALLFAVHPLHVASVAHISQRKDVLSTAFWLLTTLAYLRYTRIGGARWYAASLTLYLAGLLAKPMLVTLPLTFLLLDWWPLGRIDFTGLSREDQRRRVIALVREKIPFFLLAFGISVVTVIVQSRTGAVATTDSISIATRIANAAVTYVTYLRMTLWPHGLSVFYPYPETIPVWKVLAAGSFLAICTLTAVTLRRRRPYLLAGWLWYLITLLPVIGIIQVGAQSMADRYTYVPLIGVFVAAVWTCAEIAGDSARRRVAAAVASVVAAGILIPVSWIQIGTWVDTRSVWTHAVQVDPANGMAHFNLGVELYQNGDFEGAARSQTEAVRTLRRGNTLRADAGIALGNAYMKLQRYEDAANAYTGAVETQSHLNDTAGAATAHCSLAYALLAQNRHTDAAAEFNEALRLNPDLGPARQGLDRATGKQ